jgi:thioredoxin family protein
MAKLKVPVGPDDHAQGPADAPVTLVEYGDYECPHCGHAHPIVKALQKRFGQQVSATGPEPGGPRGRQEERQLFSGGVPASVASVGAGATGDSSTILATVSLYSQSESFLSANHLGFHPNAAPPGGSTAQKAPFAFPFP